MDRLNREPGFVGAGLAHPNIARLLDGGITPEGEAWFALECVDGDAITRARDRRRLRVDARVGVFGQACDAIEHAHRHLVVHRDRKPANILVDDRVR